MNSEEFNFEKIYQEFLPRIAAYLSRLVGDRDAEDVTQEVFIKVNAALGNFRGDSSLSTWIYRIATNAAIDYLRRRPVLQDSFESSAPSDEESHIEVFIDAADGGGIPPDTQAIRKEMNECIRGIVDGLQENYRAVLVLSDLEGLTNNEIADVLEISLDTVKIRLHRARVLLRKELNAKCTFYRDERNELACDRKTFPITFPRQ